MKKFIVFLFYLLCISISNAQNTEKKIVEFWNAVNEQNHLKIISHGNSLISYWEEKNITFDTIQSEVRIRTALSNWNLGNHHESLRLNLQTLELIKNYWWVNNSDYSICLNNIARNYESIGDFENALNFDLENISIIERIAGTKNHNYANALLNISSNFTNTGNDDNEILYNQKALDIYREIEGESSLIFKNCIYQLAQKHLWKADSLSLSKSISLFESYIQLSDQYGDNLNIGYCNAFQYIGQAYFNLKYHAIDLYNTSYQKQADSTLANQYVSSALVYLNNADKLYKRLKFEASENYLLNLKYLSMANESLKHFKEALKIIELYTKKCIVFYGIESLEAISASLDEASLLAKLNKNTAAINKINQSEELIRANNEDLNLKSIFYSTKANILIEIGDTLNAIESYLKELEVNRALFGNNSPQYVLTNRIISNYYFDVNRYTEALNHLDENLSIIEKKYSKRSNEYIQELFHQKLVPFFNCFNSTNIEGEKQWMDSIIDQVANEFKNINESFALDKDLQNEILVLLNNFYAVQGDLSKSLDLRAINNQKSLDVVNQVSKKHSEIDRRLMESKNISWLGNHYEADKIVTSILTDFDSIPKEHFRRITAQKAFTSFLTGKLVEARHYAYLTDSLWKDDYSEKYQLENYLQNLDQLWSIEYKLKNFKKSKEIQRQIHSLVRKNFEESDPFFISNLLTFASREFFNGDLTAAEANFRKGLMLEEQFGDPINNGFYKSSQIRLAKILFQKGAFKEADSLFQASVNSQLNLFKSEIVQFSLEDFNFYKFNRTTECLDFINYALNRLNDNPKLFKNALENWFFLNNLKSRQGRLLRESADKHDMRYLYESQLKYFYKAIEQNPAILMNKNINVDSLRLAIKKTEMKIGSMNDELSFEHSIKSIQKNLKNGEVFISVIPFIYRDFKRYDGAEIETKLGQPSYLIIRISKQSDTIDYRLLNNVEELEQEFYSNYNQYYLNPNSNIKEDQLSYLAYFQPIKELFQLAEKIYFQPSGIFNEVNIESLFDSSTGKFVFEDYNISYRDILSPQNEEIQSLETSVLMGGANFGDGTLLAQYKNTEKKNSGCVVGIQTENSTEGLQVSNVLEGSSAQKEGVKVGDIIILIENIEVPQKLLDDMDISYFLYHIRGKENTHVNLKCLRPITRDTLHFRLIREFRNEEKPTILFPELPGSLNEIITLNDLFNKMNIKSSLYLGEDANEANLKKINSPSLLHIATHSFTSLPDQRDPFMGVLDEFRYGDPMLFNALVLSGVNDFNYWENDLEDENGYVNALELSLLNLADTYLAVLSSCESGSGASGIGEGISGFKEALFRAGANNVILSKHSVSDEITRDFFVLFYKNLIESNDAVHDVLRKTKLQFMSSHNHPFYWSAFIHY